MKSVHLAPTKELADPSPSSFNWKEHTKLRFVDLRSISPADSVCFRFELDRKFIVNYLRVFRKTSQIMRSQHHVPVKQIHTGMIFGINVEHWLLNLKHLFSHSHSCWTIFTVSSCYQFVLSVATEVFFQESQPVTFIPGTLLFTLGPTSAFVCPGTGNRSQEPVGSGVARHSTHKFTPLNGAKSPVVCDECEYNHICFHPYVVLCYSYLLV